MDVRTGIGQDSHRFRENISFKPLLLGGVIFDGNALEGNSDADVVLHAITNAVSGITGVNILGSIADKLCFEDNITNSAIYLSEAMKYLKDFKITHVSVSIECLIPKISPKIDDMKSNISKILNIDIAAIGITATTGEYLTSFGKGNGIMVTAIVTAIKN